MDFLRARGHGLWDDDNLMNAAQLIVKEAFFGWRRMLARALQWRRDHAQILRDEHASAPVICSPLLPVSTTQHNKIFLRASRLLVVLVLALASIVGVQKAEAAVAFDAAVTSTDLASQTSASWSHTTSGSNRYLVVGLSGWDTSRSLSSVTVTYNGVAMTKLGGIEAANQNTVVLWGLVNPASGTHTVQISNIPAGYSELGGGSVSFTGVDQTTSTGTLASLGYGTSAPAIRSCSVEIMGSAAPTVVS